MGPPLTHLCLGLASRIAPPPARPGGGVVKMNKSWFSKDPGALGAADRASRGSIGTEGGRRGALRRVLTRRALGHWQTSPALASKPRGARYLDRGTSRWNSRAPARQGPSPEERHPVYPQRFNWFESTPTETLRDYRSKPIIIQLVNHIRT